MLELCQVLLLDMPEVACGEYGLEREGISVIGFKNLALCRKGSILMAASRARGARLMLQLELEVERGRCKDVDIELYELTDVYIKSECMPVNRAPFATACGISGGRELELGFSKSVGWIIGLSGNEVGIRGIMVRSLRDVAVERAFTSFSLCQSDCD
ncbi:hypothetical protein Tco_0524016 [Tanacetum coccineum]